MTSHRYDFRGWDVAGIVLPSLLPLAAFAVMMHLGTWSRLLPPARPTLDMDRTILIHQAEAAQKQQAADVLLMGDSSCLMNVSAKDLGRQLGGEVLNLGCLSYLGLKEYALLLEQYTNANPGSAKAVVVLMHPEALRQIGPDPVYAEFLRSTLGKSAPVSLSIRPNRLNQMLGIDLFKGHLLARWIPAPLRGTYRQHYGFTHDLENLLQQEQGSLVDPERQPFQGNAEYHLAKSLEAASRDFRKKVPAGTKLFVGITPVPASFPKKDYAEVHAKMLKVWSHWLEAEPLPLPATMPDNLFSKSTHLNPAGVRDYTSLLAEALKK